MNLLWTVLVFSKIFVPTVVYSELYSALTELDVLLNTQRVILDIIKEEVSATEQRLEKIKKYQHDYGYLLNLSSQDFSQFVSNPINAFILIKKLTVDWTEAKMVLFQNEYEGDGKLNNTLFPDNSDLLGASVALLRLQDTYNLEASTIENGELFGAAAAFTFSVDDCFELGRQALIAGYLDYAMIWFETSYQKLIFANCTSKVTLTDILKYMKLTNFEKTRMSALTVAQSLLQFSQYISISDNSNNESLFELMNPGSQYNMYTNPADLETYHKLCQQNKHDSSKSHVLHHLTCKLSAHHPFFKLQPIKEEQLWLAPKISIYYDVISDKEIEILTSLARPALERAEVAEYKGGISHRVSEGRVTKIAWLQRRKYPIVDPIYRRIEDITGLSTETAEDFQMANYGLGGHFHLHLDVLPDSEVYFGPESGNRIATWLTYLSDVDRGGATVFPRLNLTVWPKKGSALFWYNIKSDGVGDFRTLHGACPVVTGSKWVSNVWLHERGQEFRLRCGKYSDSSLTLTHNAS